MKTISNLTVNWAHENKIRHWYKDETTSTNSVAKEEFSNVEDFKLFVTNFQTQGRGRGENTWSNTREKNSLLSTWAFKTQHTPQHFLPALIGLATFQACQKAWYGLAWSMKAPNDIFINDKKVAGILTEVIQQGAETLILVGLGFNIFSEPEAIDTASFLVNFLGEKKSFTEEQWVLFLNSFKSYLHEAIDSSEQLKMSESSRELILEAINANPWKKEVYLEVTDQGDLVTESSTQSWRDL